MTTWRIFWGDINCMPFPSIAMVLAGGKQSARAGWLHGMVGRKMIGS